MYKNKRRVDDSWKDEEETGWDCVYLCVCVCVCVYPCMNLGLSECVNEWEGCSVLADAVEMPI